VFAVVCEFTRYLRNDVWQKYYEALDIDLGTGHHPESDGWGISVSDIECMDEAADNLARRVRAVQENPTAFSQYTVEFVRFLDKQWNYLRAS
jgi:hypothetical protein